MLTVQKLKELLAKYNDDTPVSFIVLTPEDIQTHAKKYLADADISEPKRLSDEVAYQALQMFNEDYMDDVSVGLEKYIFYVFEHLAIEEEYDTEDDTKDENDDADFDDVYPYPNSRGLDD